MNKCKIKEIYTADVGRIVKLKDSPTMYEAGKTLNGYCYKDYKAFKNEPDKF